MIPERAVKRGREGRGGRNSSRPYAPLRVHMGLEELGVEVAFAEEGVGEDLLVVLQVGLDAADLDFIQGALHPVDGGIAGCRPRR